MTETQVSPRVQVEFTYLHYLVFFVYMCVRACSCFICCFSVSTGELKYGDVCDTFMHVEKVLSSCCGVQGGQRVSTLWVCPEKAIIFPNGSHFMLLFMWTGYHTQGKSFWKDKMEVFEKEKRKIWKSYFMSSERLIVKHRNLQCLFICFYLFWTIPPLLPTPDLLKKYQVNAKGHFHNSSELPKEETSPSRKIPSASFRKTQGVERLRSFFLSFLSNGLEMYYYANVNFDTEFKKRLLDFFLFSKKKKGPICGHHCFFIL